MRAFVSVLTFSALLLAATTQALAGPAARSQSQRAAEVRKALRLPTFQLDNPLLKPWPLLSRFDNPAVEALPDSTRFLSGPWGMARWQGPGWGRLTLDSFATSMMPWAEALSSDEQAWQSWEGGSNAGLSQVLWTPTGDRPAHVGDLSVFGSSLVTPSVCLRRPVTFARYGAESDRFALLACGGSVAPEAIDRLSVMVRPVGVARPGLPLPEQPVDGTSPNGEWMPSIRLVQPRLLWLVQQIANAYPGRSIYVVSGYRPGEHEGQHNKGRAIDLSVMGVDKEDVFRLCRRLPDVGCGYYPHSNFVHVDVRSTGTGNAYWVDDSQPGEPSHYVDSWPGVVESGAACWDGWRERPAAGAAASRHEP